MYSQYFQVFFSTCFYCIFEFSTNIEVTASHVWNVYGPEKLKNQIEKKISCKIELLTTLSADHVEHNKQLSV